jgi:hypothetical protein
MSDVSSCHDGHGPLLTNPSSVLVLDGRAVERLAELTRTFRGAMRREDESAILTAATRLAFYVENTLHNEDLSNYRREVPR